MCRSPLPSPAKRSYRALPDGLEDLLDGVKLALPRSRADPRDVFPVFRSLDVLRPERPGPALGRSRGVHRASGLGVPEDAVSAGPLDKAISVSDLPDELPRKPVD